MAFRVASACLIAAVAAACAAPGAAASERRAPAGPAWVPGELLVRFKAGVSAEERSRARRRRGARVEEVLPVPRVQLLELEPGTPVARAVASFESDPAVEFAEPNGLVRAQGLPDDPMLGDLWGLERIAAPSAWDVTTGSADVVVGVVDTGVAPDHPDLAPHLVPGRDFVHDDALPGDLDGHGTHVAGTIGAVGDNGVGVSGVAQTVGIMPLRALDHTGYGDWADVAEAFTYAAERNVPVVNASLGGGPSETVRAAIEAAPGTLFVVAAGNEGVDVDAAGNDSYPCEVPLANVLCVAASDPQDARASFSNWGANSVDIAAPGTNTTSTHPAVQRPLDERFESGLGLWTGNGSWGTSAAAASEGAQGLADSPSGNYANGSDTHMRTAAPVPVGQDCQLVFDLKLDVAGNGGDRFSVEAAQDPSGPWTSLYTRNSDSSGWQTLWLDLRRAGEYDFYGRETYLRFRLTADGSVGADGASVDWVEVSCRGGEDYAVLSGTSMATPHVAGVAALLLAHEPGLSPGDLRNAILAGGTPVSWAQPTLSGRRLDAAGALAAAGAPSEAAAGPSPSPEPAPPPAEPAPSQPAPPPAQPAPAPAPAPAPGGTTTVDGDAPKLRVRVSRWVRLSRVRRSGLRTRARCSEACRVTARLYARSRSGRRVLVGRGSARTRRAGTATLTVRISRRGRRVLGRLSQRQRLTLKVSVADRAGNRARVSRRISLRRR